MDFMTKSLEDAIENCVASVPIAMWKYKKYLMREKFRTGLCHRKISKPLNRFLINDYQDDLDELG